MPAKPEPPPNAPPALPELAPEAPPAVAERPTVTFEAGPRVKIVVDRLTSTDPTFRKPCNVTAFVHLDGSPPSVTGVPQAIREPTMAFSLFTTTPIRVMYFGVSRQELR
jgi:hypothetical protein